MRGKVETLTLNMNPEGSRRPASNCSKEALSPPGEPIIRVSLPYTHIILYEKANTSQFVWEGVRYVRGKVWRPDWSGAGKYCIHIHQLIIDYVGFESKVYNASSSLGKSCSVLFPRNS